MTIVFGCWLLTKKPWSQIFDTTVRVQFLAASATEQIEVEHIEINFEKGSI